MRLIDADAFSNYIKRAIEDQAYDSLKMDDITLTVGDVLDAVIAELDGTSIVGFKNAPTIEPEPRWIPCSERLPKKAGNYLVTDHNGDIARYIYLDTESSKDYWMRCAKAWMPLPEPYKGGQDETD